MKAVTNVLLALVLFALPVFAQRTSTTTRKPATAPAQVTPAKAPETTNDLKLTQRVSMEGMNIDSTVYIKGERERTEQNIMSMQMVTIKECDLRRNIQLNDRMKVYKIDPFSDGTSTQTTTESRPAPVNKTTRKGGVVTINIKMTDTGERKEMFGYTARHLKMSMSFVTSPDACAKGQMRMESDGWYINFRNNFSCEEEYIPRQALMRDKPDCIDDFRYNIQGNVKIGYPADVTMTMYDEKGKPFSMRQQILELSRAQLEQALFEIPAGYTEGDPYSMKAMIGGMNLESMGKLADVIEREQPTRTNSASGAKKAGTMRLGILLPSAKIGQNEIGIAVQNSLVRSFNRDGTLEVVPVSSRAEASAQQCDFILNSSLTHTPGKSGGLGGFMKKAGQLGQIAAGNLGVAVPQSSSDTAAAIKAKDEIAYEYQLTRVDGSPVAGGSQKRKANSDGEDLLSPILSQVAAEVQRAVVKK